MIYKKHMTVIQSGRALTNVQWRILAGTP